MTSFDKANNLLAVCVAQGRITEHGYASYLQSATAYYDETLAILAEQAAAQESSADPRQWSFAKLQREAPEQLEAMRQQEPGRYEALKDLYVAELKSKKASPPQGKSSLPIGPSRLDKATGPPHRKPPMPIGPARLEKASKKPPISEFARMRREEPAALEQLRKDSPAKYEQLRQEHLHKLKQAK